MGGGRLRVCVCVLGGGFKPLAASSHSSARACDSGDTWSHLSAVYTFLSWSLSYGGDHLSDSKKRKQAGWGGRRREGEREGGIDGWTERRKKKEERPEPSVWMLVGIVKRDERWQLNALIFCVCGTGREGGPDHEAQHTEGLRLRSSVGWLISALRKHHQNPVVLTNKVERWSLLGLWVASKTTSKIAMAFQRVWVRLKASFFSGWNSIS